MSLIVLPNTFVPGTTIASSPMNANFASIVGVVNGNLDSSNIASVNAVKVNPGTFQSGTFVIPGTLEVGILDVTTGFSLISVANLFVSVNASIASLEITNNASIGASLSVAGRVHIEGTGTALIVDNDAEISDNLHVVGTTQLDDSLIAASAEFQGSVQMDYDLTVTGPAKASAGGPTNVNVSYVPPFYAPNGTALADTVHGVIGQAAFSGSVAPGASSSVAIPAPTSHAAFGTLAGCVVKASIASVNSGLVATNVGITGIGYDSSVWTIAFTNLHNATTLTAATFNYELVGV